MVHITYNTSSPLSLCLKKLLKIKRSSLEVLPSSEVHPHLGSKNPRFPQVISWKCCATWFHPQTAPRPAFTAASGTEARICVAENFSAATWSFGEACCGPMENDTTPQKKISQTSPKKHPLEGVPRNWWLLTARPKPSLCGTGFSSSLWPQVATPEVSEMLGSWDQNHNFMPSTYKLGLLLSSHIITKIIIIIIVLNNHHHYISSLLRSLHIIIIIILSLLRSQMLRFSILLHIATKPGASKVPCIRCF